MTTGAPSTAPDVSGVLAAFDEIMDSNKTHSVNHTRQALGQAAEQACYRDRLATLERLWQSAYHTHCHLDDTGCDVAQEIAAVQQLLAGSA